MTETEISDWCVVALCIDTQFALYSRLQDLILIILFIQRIKRRLQIWKYPVLDWMVARNLKDIFALNAAIGLSEHLEDKEGKMWKIHDYPNKIMCFLDLLPMVISFGQTLEALKHWCWLLSILQDPSFFFLWMFCQCFVMLRIDIQTFGIGCTHHFQPFSSVKGPTYSGNAQTTRAAGPIYLGCYLGCLCPSRWGLLLYSCTLAILHCNRTRILAPTFVLWSIFSLHDVF